MPTDSSTDTFRSEPDEPSDGDALPPTHVARYRIERELGRGGFGIVYLARDEELGRFVAIKVPHARLVRRPEDAAAYLAEARAVAGLDHPHIVPVFDVGRTDRHPCFVVSKYVEGQTLAQRLRDDRLSFGEAAELVGTVADALHHAHRQGLVHRDVKPGNILLDRTGRAHLADFGLALRDEDVGRGPRYAGTPAYMSPEQARGEGHRVDGRSDVFSLGVVLYELLTGRRPFKAETKAELLDLVAEADPRPPRQIDDRIPRELERVCLKALMKRAAERYSTALDLAADLRHFLAEVPPEVASTVRMDRAGDPPPTPPPPTPASTAGPVRIVPKGLRAFDAHDADFYLELLPGPRDRDGLPDAVRFWKHWAEAADAVAPLPVGVMYGPSGCGKSSLVRAGLLPRLSPAVVPVYAEATAEETEARLLAGLRHRCPGLPADLGLKDTLAAARRGRGGTTVLLVIDQFEQWLHARGAGRGDELVQALRQCDGTRVRCLILVRDDFWLAVSRFLKELEVALVEGHNSLLADLFDPPHARKVLAALGRAYGALPEPPAELGPEHRRFLERAVGDLAQGGKVVSVRLALFAQMMRAKEWSLATLAAVGGAHGVGVTFLEETFAAATAPPEHRYHQAAARGVLRALLPESGADIKGHMRPDAELRDAAGYRDRPGEFDALLRVLDTELRLITPTDPGGVPRAGPAAGEAARGEGRYYQLTHDYLVPAVRDWLAAKQRETRRGRAELLLAERAAAWGGRREGRHLPSPTQHLMIRLLVGRSTRTPLERALLAAAAARDSLRLALAALTVGVAATIAFGAWGRAADQRAADRAAFLVQSLLDADTRNLPAILDQMAGVRHRVDPLLREALARPEVAADAHHRLHLQLALLGSDAEMVGPVTDHLLSVRPEAFATVRGQLARHAERVVDRLWAEAGDPAGDAGRRIRAAAALAAYADPGDGGWERIAGPVAAALGAENAAQLGYWKDAFREAGHHLLPPLAEFVADERCPPFRRQALCELYREFAAGRAERFEPLERKVAPAGPGAVPPEAAAKRRANAAVALLLTGRPQQAWPLLALGPDPTVRSYLVERLGPAGCGRALCARLPVEGDVSTRRALLLALGECAAEECEAVGPLVQTLYTDDPDPGVHAAAGWLLRRWGRGADANGADARLATGQAVGRRKWFVTPLGLHFSVIPVGDGRELAVAQTEITVKLFRQLDLQFVANREIAPHEDCPASLVSFQAAAAFCNRLSRADGMADDQLCYESGPDGKGGVVLKLAADYKTRSGYRLPEEAEWESACRAGTRTDWLCGAGDRSLISRYAWWYGNSYSGGTPCTHPVGELLPNDHGLFDVMGNVFELCHVSPVAGGDAGPKVAIRGGSYVRHFTDLTSQYRQQTTDTNTSVNTGLRVVRKH